MPLDDASRRPLRGTGSPRSSACAKPIGARSKTPRPCAPRARARAACRTTSWSAPTARRRTTARPAPGLDPQRPGRAGRAVRAGAVLRHRPGPGRAGRRRAARQRAVGAGRPAGLHALTFLLWLASFLLRPAAATGLGRLWLWVTRKLARGPDTALAPQALLNLLARAGAGCSARSATCSADRVVRRAGDAVDGAVHRQLPLHLGHHAARAGHLRLADPGDRLAAGPGGLPPPDAATVLASDGVQTLPAAAQVQWSLWLIGVVVVYGVLPRLAAALLCLVVLRRRLAGLRIDPALPGHAALRPAGTRRGLHRPGPPVDPLHEPRLSAPAPAGWTAVRCCWRWNCPTTCPGRRPQPRRHPDRRLDTREERRRILDALADAAASRLLIACDARQTPDRGTLTLIAELAAHASRRASGCCCRAHEDGPARAPVRAQLAALGLPRRPCWRPPPTRWTGWRPDMADSLIRIAVVGHTNTGKTSLLRTLTRDTRRSRQHPRRRRRAPASRRRRAGMVRHARHGRQHLAAGIPGAAGGARTAGRTARVRPGLKRPLRTGSARAGQDAGLRRGALRHRRARPGAGQAPRRTRHPGRLLPPASAELRQRAAASRPPTGARR